MTRFTLAKVVLPVRKNILPILLVCMGLMSSFSANAQNDLPPPTPNIESIPAGAYIIPMDNTLQAVSGIMNLKAYGLAARLLWSDVHLKWAIRAGKAKDAADFTASATRVYPTAGTTGSFGFKSGPFIIMPQDTAVAGPIIRAFNAAQTVANRVNVYKLETAQNIDIRYTLDHKPLIGIYDDGGNADIHAEILEEAAFNTSYYSVLESGVVIDSTSCYTFSSTPHWAVSNYTGTVKLRLDNLASFLNSGGNFFAQCEGIDAIENYPNQRYQTYNGFVTSVNQRNPVVFANADMPMLQFEGVFEPVGGSIENFYPVGGNAGWRPNKYSHIYSIENLDNVGPLDTVWNATASKFFGQNFTVGGNVFYLSGHNYDANSVAEQNGQRMYLNAVFMPATRWINQGQVASNSPLCAGDTLKLQMIPPISGFSFQWTGPLNYNTTVQNPQIANTTVSNAGTYTGYLIDATGCKVGYPLDVTIGPKPNITLTASPATICEGASSTLSYSPTSGINVLGWYANCDATGASLGTTPTLTVTPNATTTYSVIVAAAQGCTDTFCVTVTVNDKPNITIVDPSNNGTICQGSTTVLGYTPSAGLTTIGWFLNGNPNGCAPTGASLGNRCNIYCRTEYNNFLCSSCAI
jgi:hypothetical protein